MQTLAWLFLVSGMILIRQVTKGRTLNVGEDIRDMFVGMVTFDTEAVQEVVSRTGDSAYVPMADTADTADTSGEGTMGGLGTLGSSDVLDNAIKRGNAAKGYKFGTYPPEFGVGPNWYDCSGLVGKAMQDAGMKVGRITTYTWPRIAPKHGYKRVSKPVTGDIVVWQRGGTSGHMGIVTSGGKFYGAHSPRTGIKEIPLAGIRGTVSYWHKE
jgi:cell wall-associated NlpC family hydrolase